MNTQAVEPRDFCLPSVSCLARIVCTFHEDCITFRKFNLRINVPFILLYARVVSGEQQAVEPRRWHSVLLYEVQVQGHPSGEQQAGGGMPFAAAGTRIIRMLSYTPKYCCILPLQLDAGFDICHMISPPVYRKLTHVSMSCFGCVALARVCRWFSHQLHPRSSPVVSGYESVSALHLYK